MSSPQTSGVLGVFKPFPSKADKNTYSKKDLTKVMRGMFVSTITEVQQMESFSSKGIDQILYKAIKTPILEE